MKPAVFFVQYFAKYFYTSSCQIKKNITLRIKTVHLFTQRLHVQIFENDLYFTNPLNIAV